MSPQVLPGAAPAGAQEQQQQGGGSGGGGGGVSSEVLELVDLFLAAQGQRAAAYCRFDAAFRAYLQNGAEGPYRCAGWGGASCLGGPGRQQGAPAPACLRALALVPLMGSARRCLPIPLPQAHHHAADGAVCRPEPPGHRD